LSASSGVSCLARARLSSAKSGITEDGIPAPRIAASGSAKFSGLLVERIAPASFLPMRFPARSRRQSPGCWWWGRVLACESFGRSLPSLGAWLPSAPRRKFRGACFLRRGTVGTGPIVKTRTALQPAGCGANVRAAPSVQSRRRGTSGTDCVGPRRRFPKSTRLQVHRATPQVQNSARLEIPGLSR